MWLYNWFPFLRWKVAKYWKADLVAAVSVTVVFIPQALAYAQLAGMPPQYGLYAGLLPVVLAALWGSSSFLQTGPTAMVSLLTFSILSPLATSGSASYLELAVLLSFMVGTIELLIYILKLGNIIQYLSHSVIVGFTNAAAIIIAFSQLPKLFGLPSNDNHDFINGLLETVGNLPQIHLGTAVIGFLSLIVILISKRVKKTFPIVPIVLAVAIFVSWAFGFDGGIVGRIPSGLPVLSIPIFSLEQMELLSKGAIIIAAIGYIEGVSIAKSLASKNGGHFNPNRELIGQGLANLGAGFSGAGPVAGSFGRSAVSYSSGARSSLSAVFVGFMVLIVLLFFTPYFYYLPQAALAAVVIAAVLELIDIPKVIFIWKNFRKDGLVVLSTFFATLYFAPHIDNGVVVGVAVSIALLVYAASNHEVLIFKCSDAEHCKRIGMNIQQFASNKYVCGVCFDRSLTFANAEYFRKKILYATNCNKSIKYVLVMSRGINDIDASGEETLSKLIDELKEKNIVLVFSGLKSHVLSEIKKTNIVKKIGRTNIYPGANRALAGIDRREKAKDEGDD